MHGERVGVVSVFDQAMMDLGVHYVVFIAELIVVKVARVDDAQTGIGQAHISFFPSLAKCCSYILTSLSQRLMAMTAAQANP